MFDSQRLGQARLPVFSTISVAAVMLIVVAANGFISDLSLHSITLQSNSKKLRPGTAQKVLLSVNEEAEQSYTQTLSSPNGMDRERIGFDDRVRAFFGGDKCSVQFFMTWISQTNPFGPREFLAAESLFKAHPSGCLAILSGTMDSARGYRVLKPLIDRGFRILAVTPDLQFLFKNTPAESWFDEIKEGNKNTGEIPLAQNLSNLIRLAALYKYGGVYLDTDFIVLKDFSGLRNSIGAQSVDSFGNWTRLNNAVLVFDRNHPLLHRFIEEFASTFDGNKWGHNGPYLVSRVVARVSAGRECNFTVLPPMSFYPVDWNRIGGLFRKPASRSHSRWMEAKVLQLKWSSYGVHLWNKMSSGFRIEEGSVIGRLASTHCVICKSTYSS